MAHSEGLDHFRRGEPLPGLPAASPAGFDHFRRGEPVPALETVATTDTVTVSAVVVSFVLPAPTATTITQQLITRTVEIEQAHAGTVRITQAAAATVEITQVVSEETRI